MRHAEKAAQPADDPPLTPAGVARANALAAALADAGVRSILTTQLLRTRETGRPLAAKLGIAPQVVGVTRAAREHARAVADAVREQPAGAVLVVGHSNTVPLIIEALGGPKLPDICDAAYANLYVVQLHADGKVSLARTEYGARSGGDADCPGMSPR
ncbi:MAG: histidine phosphatase family protein [Gemmatimonadetes bacterium]|nr:histidine phosphatase family protein [Gemmatimonadota bacterium]